MPTYRLNGATANLRSDLHHARILAARKHRQYRVAFSAANKVNDGNAYEFHQGNQSVGSTSWTLAVERKFSDYAGVTVSATADPVFSPRGTTSSFVTVTLQNRGVEKKIEIRLGGKIKVK